MKGKGVNVLKLFIVLAVLGALSAVSVVGIGKNKLGSASDIQLGLDLAGGVSITYETVKKNPTAQEIADTKYKLQQRVDNYSTESTVYTEGDSRINVDIPGVTDANKILEELGNMGSLQFVDSDGNVVLEGSDIANAEATIVNGTYGNSNIVALTLKDEGTKKFEKATRENLNKVIRIVYDGNEISAPVVSTVISNGKASIEGQKTYEEAELLASQIRIGALPLELKELRSNIVGAKLGTEAIETSLLAGAIGLILVILFMIIYYRIPGVAASLALLMYVGLMVISLNIFNVTLTLPGVAGIILSIGMAVDANCIIFTRIREEIATGKTVRSSIKIGFQKALSAIVDGNVTTLIAAVVLYVLGSGTIKGFAQTLGIGIVLSMISALFITKFILNAMYGVGLNKEGMYGVQKEHKNIDFVKNKAKFFCISVVLILIGVVTMVCYKVNGKTAFEYGLDFVGGTSTEVTFPEETDSNAIRGEIESLVAGIIGDPNVETSKVEGAETLIIKTKELTLDQRTSLEEKLTEQYQVDPDLIQVTSISSIVSSEMKSDAILAVVIATICMLIYIWLRFKNFSFGAAAVMALLHDVLVVVMVYVVARISLGNTFIACILTIVGYSINATIVIFDRIRENMGTRLKKESVADVVNNSITQTISRSINTSLTTFFMVFTLFLFGVDSIKEFAVPLMAGIVCGAYSSVCIAGTLWYVLQKKFMKTEE